MFCCIVIGSRLDVRLDASQNREKFDLNMQYDKVGDGC